VWTEKALPQKNLSFAGSPFQIPVCFRLFSFYASFLKKKDSEPKAHASKKHFFKYNRPKTRKTDYLKLVGVSAPLQNRGVK